MDKVNYLWSILAMFLTYLFLVICLCFLYVGLCLSIFNRTSFKGGVLLQEKSSLAPVGGMLGAAKGRYRRFNARKQFVLLSTLLCISTSQHMLARKHTLFLLSTTIKKPGP